MNDIFSKICTGLWKHSSFSLVFLKRHFIEFSEGDFWELATKAPRRAAWLLGWHCKKAQGEEGMSESSSKLPLQVSSTQQRAAGNCSQAAPAQAQMDLKLQDVPRPRALHGQLRRDRDSQGRAGIQRWMLLGYWARAAKQLWLLSPAPLTLPLLTKEYD